MKKTPAAKQANPVANRGVSPQAATQRPRPAAKAAKQAGPPASPETATALAEAEDDKPVRNQPKRQSRKKRKG